MDIARESGKPGAGDRKNDRWPHEESSWRKSTLLNQSFVVNPDLTVAEAAAKEAGATITGFARLEVGEGIEVEKEDFAAEVAKVGQS